MKVAIVSMVITLALVLGALAGCGGAAPTAPTPNPVTTPAPVTTTVPPVPAPVVTPAPPVPASTTIPSPKPPAPTPVPPPPSPSPASPAATTTTPPMPRGTVDPDIGIAVYQTGMAWPGTTLLPDNHNLARPRIIEVNMLGEVVWQYLVPQHLRQFTNPGFDVEPLPNGNIMFVLPRNGIYEIDRSGKVVWSYLTAKISHDADRLSNGNTIFAFGAFDQKSDAQVTEINPKGETVWSWRARDYFDKPPYGNVSDEGWTHTNAVVRLPNGNTLVSLRNFNVVPEVDPRGMVIRTIGEGVFEAQHDPEMLPNGNILIAVHSRVVPHRAIEIDPETGKIVWEFPVPRQLLRDANRLPNGNTLITGATAIIEVTPAGRIAWQLRLKEALQREEAPARGFYKAERVAPDKRSPAGK